MGTEENKALAQDWFGRCYAGNLEAIDELIAEEYVGHFNGAPPMRGREGLRRGNAETKAAASDIRVDVEELIAEGDTVVARYTVRGTNTGVGRGLPATGKPFEMTGITICRIRDGRIIEHHGVYDMLGLLQQVGLIAAPTAE